MERISSARNERIKLASALARAVSRRRETGLALIEGARICAEAAASGRVEECFVTAAAREKLGGALDSGEYGEVFEVSGAAEARLATTGTPQGIYCTVRTAGMLRGCDELAPGRYVCLDGVSDPGNLGAVLRTAEAFGADGAVLSEGCADVFSPKAMRASMGGVFRLPVYVSGDLARLLARLGREGFGCYAAVPDRRAADITGVEFPENVAAVIGSEAHGVSGPAAAVCTAVTIPMSGGAESLNAAAAASIVLWEILGRRGRRGEEKQEKEKTKEA